MTKYVEEHRGKDKNLLVYQESGSFNYPLVLMGNLIILNGVYYQKNFK